MNKLLTIMSLLATTVVVAQNEYSYTVLHPESKKVIFRTKQVKKIKQKLDSLDLIYRKREYIVTTLFNDGHTTQKLISVVRKSYTIRKL